MRASQKPWPLLPGLRSVLFVLAGAVRALPVCGQPLQIVHEFAEPISQPYGNVILAADGSLYGTCYKQEPEGYGMGGIFTLKPDGTGYRVLQYLTNLNPFYPDGGSGPYGGLIQGKDGVLYGMTSGGGSTYGAVFRVNTDGTGLAVLHAFTQGVQPGRPPDGQTPVSALFQASNEALYGTTHEGGKGGVGIVFSLSPDGTGYTILHNFSGSDSQDGANPGAGLIEASDGRLYGTTVAGGAHGSGTLFRIGKDGSGFQVMHSFDASDPADGDGPRGILLQASDGLLYGTTKGGGLVGSGTVFRFDPVTSTLRVLHSFDGSVAPYDSVPYGGLRQGLDGYLYGTTTGTPWGNVFRLATDGSQYQVLHSFNAHDRQDGSRPYGSLEIGPGGTLYGTTVAGGSNNVGTVFSIQPDGSHFTQLQSLGASDGANPHTGLFLASDGNLYGTSTFAGAFGGGTAFRINPSDGTLLVIHDFDPLNTNDGNAPDTGLIEGSDGNIYGTTLAGGPLDGGTVFGMNKAGGNFVLLGTFPYGSYPEGRLLQASDGHLYGTASVPGFVFQAGGPILHVFDGSDGAKLLTGLIQATDGQLYGTASAGGPAFNGTVFRMRLDGSGFQLIVPTGSSELLQASDGKLYGILGGTSDSLYRMNLDGTGFETIHVFGSGGPKDADRSGPPLEGNDGALYAVSGGGNFGQGTIYRIEKDGSGFAILYSFSGSDGSGPTYRLVQTSNGDLFGTTYYGGAYNGGTVFRFSLNWPARAQVLPSQRLRHQPPDLTPR